ncbi:UNVERIFIED_CONTAM: tetratricopeptide (TPR) repeat protein [Brevibacillus sp. OAP136]
MYIDEWFQSLTQRIRAIENEWQTATETRKQELLSKLWELRNASDSVVDLWLQYEEKLSQVMKHITGELAAEQLQASLEGQSPSAYTGTLKAGGKEASGASGLAMNQKSPKSDPASNAKDGSDDEDAMIRYRKGEGFFHLRLYENARGYFRELVAEAPDWETGRLYYAYSLLFCEDREEALREFRLLGKTAASKNVAAISCNAIGCMLAEEEKWLEARQAFCETLAHQPANTQAMYNMALTHLRDDEPEEAIEILDLYLSSMPDDWEAHVAWLHAAKSIAAKETAWIKETPPGLQLPIRQLDASVLYEIALFFESNGQNQRAYHCYRHLTERFPADDVAWHGMAWNVWLLHGAERALPLLKKAISLAPHKLDYLFSYGWLLLFNGEESRAASAFRFMLTKDVSNHLAKAGLIVASERLGDYPLAEMLADSLRSHNEAYLRALGNYHLGRLAAIQEQWNNAEAYFDQALEIPEASLFLTIVRNMQEAGDMANSKQEYQAPMPNVTIH